MLSLSDKVVSIYRGFFILVVFLNIFHSKNTMFSMYILLIVMFYLYGFF